MTRGPAQEPFVRALVDVRRTEQGALSARVQALVPPEDLGDVPLVEVPVLLEALLADADPDGEPGPQEAVGRPVRAQTSLNLRSGRPGPP